MDALKAILSDIKIAHTVFALPFAVMSAFIAAGGFPGWAPLFFIALAMFFARSAAMGFNRLVDAPFDQENPRTRERAIPAGKARPVEYIFFIVASGMGFIITCGFINPLALKLAPFALLVVFFYSYTKRITPYSHFFLGLALALAPVGAWVVVREEFGVPALILGGAVIFWLAGLDTIYACQDANFDNNKNLLSLPARFGVGPALKLAAFFHGVMILFLLALGAVAELSWFYAAGVALCAALLFYEHSLVSADDLSKVNVAFFNVNGYLSMGLMLFVILDTLLLTGGLGG